MSMSLFQTVLTVALLLPFFTVPFAPTPRQSVKQGSASVTINPPEATVALAALEYDGRLQSATAGA